MVLKFIVRDASFGDLIHLVYRTKPLEGKCLLNITLLALMGHVWGRDWKFYLHECPMVLLEIIEHISAWMKLGRKSLFEHTK